MVNKVVNLVVRIVTAAGQFISSWRNKQSGFLKVLKGTDHVMLCCRVFLVITTGVLFRIVQPCGKDLTHVSVALIMMRLENLQLVGTPLLTVTSLYLDALSVWYILSSCIDMWQQYQNESCVAIMTVLCITICS